MNELKEKIRQYQAQSEIIEPGAERRKDLLASVNEYTEGFLETVNERNAYIKDGLDGKEIKDSGIGESGIDINEILRMYRDNVEQQGISTVSGKFMGYIAPCSMYYSALADYIVAVTDPFSTDYSASPGAVRMEKMLLDWMADLVGYPAGIQGNLFGRKSCHADLYRYCARSP